MFRNFRFLFPHVWFRNVHDIVQFSILDLAGMKGEGADISIFEFVLEGAGEADDP